MRDERRFALLGLVSALLLIPALIGAPLAPLLLSALALLVFSPALIGMARLLDAPVAVMRSAGESAAEAELKAAPLISRTIADLPEGVAVFDVADRLIAWRHAGLHRWRYELTPTADGGTEVTETWDLSHYPAPLRALLSGLFGEKTQAAIDATLVKLKAAAEADAAA